MVAIVPLPKKPRPGLIAHLAIESQLRNLRKHIVGKVHRERQPIINIYPQKVPRAKHIGFHAVSIQIGFQNGVVPIRHRTAIPLVVELLLPGGQKDVATVEIVLVYRVERRHTIQEVKWVRRIVP